MLPKLMTIKLMHFCVMWMNLFPIKSGVSEMKPEGTGLMASIGHKAALQNPFWRILQSTHGPVRNKHYGTKDEMDYMSPTHWELAGGLQIYVAHYWEEDHKT